MEFDELIKDYSPSVEHLFTQTDRVLRSLSTDFLIEIDIPAKMTAYLLAPGYKGTVFTLLPAKEHVTLGINRGANLPDPAQLLSGSGKIHRVIKITSEAQIHSPEFIEILQTALHFAQVRLGLIK